MSAIASTSRLLLTSNVSATRHALACLHPHGSAQRFASTSTVQPSSAPEDGGKPSSVQSYKGAGKKGWYQTQMEAMKRQEEKKLALPVKADQDIPFALYAPPPYSETRLMWFSEDWLKYVWSRALNWYQSTQASRTEFGFWQGKRKPVIESAVKPLYEAIQLARASGDLSPLKGRISKTLREELETEISRRHTALSSATPKGALEWRMQGYEGVKVLSQRMNEMQRSKVLQMLVRFQSKQTLAPQGATSSSPQKVVENYVFQRKLSDGPHAKWTAIKSIPTMTVQQSVGKTDRRISELVRRRKAIKLTVV